MDIQFATCVRLTALGFIQKVYPSKTIEDTPESAGALLDFVEADKVRIQDPMMYGNKIQVIPGTHWFESKEEREKIVEACLVFHR